EPLFNGQSFYFAQTYNDIGQINSIRYPCKSDSNAACIDSPPTVLYNYTNGLLSSITGWASAITYQPNGLISSITHASNPAVNENWTADPNGMARPAGIEARNASNVQLWTTGTYAYDGAGNIKEVGDTTYTYDAFNRLRMSKTNRAAGGY